MFVYNNNSPINFNAPLPESVDVVIIGGGVIGITTAWYLRQRGVSVLVCDKGRVAGEQSSRNWGWVRVTQRDEAEVPIAMDSVNAWEELSRELGDGIGFKRGGIMTLARSDKELADCETWMEIAGRHGVDTRMFSASNVGDEIKASPAGWKGGIITPSDARAEPFTAVKTVAQGLESRGGIIREACAVRIVETQAGRISAVVTEHGTVKTQAVVCAAGAWSSKFLSNMDVSLPQLVVRGTVARTEQAPVVFEGAAGLHDVFIRRRRDGGYTVAAGMFEHTIGANSFRFLFKFLRSLSASSEMHLRIGQDVTQQSLPARRWNGDQVSPFEQHRVLNPEPSQKAIKLMREKLDLRVPALAGIPFAETWAGMIDAMPDVVPVMDRVAEYEGLYLATGFSGHGFGIGPGAGRIMADMITGETPRHNLERFRFPRFSDGSRMVPGPAI
jgi:glycine/D-amino acid oxidase-like deaminating enzyme